MPRRLDEEWLDAQSGLDPGDLAHSLHEVWQVNRYLGGNRVLLYHLRRLLTGHAAPAAIMLLDVATGAADIPLALQAWGRRRGQHVAVVGVDLNPQMVVLARTRTAAAPDVRIEQADGRQLPYDDRSFDVSVCNLALHHLDDAGAARLLREMQRVSRRGWVVADLERHPLAYLSARALAGLVWKSPLTRHDGPLSVLRSFTATEARQLVADAGVRATVHRHFPFRLAVVGQAVARGVGHA